MATVGSFPLGHQHGRRDVTWKHSIHQPSTWTWTTRSKQRVLWFIQVMAEAATTIQIIETRKCNVLHYKRAYVIDSVVYQSRLKCIWPDFTYCNQKHIIWTHLVSLLSKNSSLSLLQRNDLDMDDLSWLANKHRCKLLLKNKRMVAL